MQKHWFSFISNNTGCHHWDIGSDSNFKKGHMEVSFIRRCTVSSELRHQSIRAGEATDVVKTVLTISCMLCMIAMVDFASLVRETKAVLFRTLSSRCFLFQ